MAAPVLSSMPIGVLSAVDPDASERSRFMVNEQRALASKSTRGVFRAASHVDHGQLVNDPAQSQSVIDFVREMEDGLRAAAAP